MAGSLNRVTLIGNVGKDPEIRRTQDGRPIANLSLATSESWTDKASGEKREKTEWHTIVIFNENLCKIVEQYVKKGSKLYVDGKLATRKWQDKSGADRYSTEVVLQGFDARVILLSKAETSGYSEPEKGADSGYAAASGKGERQPQRTFERSGGPDSEIPF
jgi:single-strand DNA-binding protein